MVFPQCGGQFTDNNYIYYVVLDERDRSDWFSLGSPNFAIRRANRLRIGFGELPF